MDLECPEPFFWNDADADAERFARFLYNFFFILTNACKHTVNYVQCGIFVYILRSKKLGEFFVEKFRNL